MMTMHSGCVRVATVEDGSRLLSLWEELFDETEPATDAQWRIAAREWFERSLDQDSAARSSVVEVDGEVVATAIGTLEIGVPNPHCPRGRTVRLANVITRPAHRGRGYGTALVRDVIAWAVLISADRVDLSTTANGLRMYERLGFEIASGRG